MSEALDQVYAQCLEDNNTTAFGIMLKSLAATYYNASEVSAQEAAYNILGLRMVESSVSTVFVPTSKPDDRVHILKAQQDLQLLPPESTEIFVPVLVEHYINRPDQLEHITLDQFAAYYTYTKARPGSSGAHETDAQDQQQETEDGAPADDDDNAPVQEENVDAAATENDAPADQQAPSGNAAPSDDDAPPEDAAAAATNHSIANGSAPGQVFALKNNDGYIKRRKVSKVIRYFRYNIDDSPEDYFRTLLMLYHPWRDEEAELLSGDNQQRFLHHQNKILEARAEFCKVDDAALDEFLDSMMNDRRDNDEDEDEGGEVASTHGADYHDRENDPRRFTLDVDDAEEGDYHRQADLEQHMSSSAARSPQTYAETVTLPNRLSNQAYQQLIASLNPGQRQYLNHIMNYIRYNREEVIQPMFSAGSVSQRTFSPFYHFITGGAGSGKTLLIKALYETMVRHFDAGSDRDMATPSVVLSAFTGKAAFNINGQTIHKLFNVPVEQYDSGASRDLRTLSASVAHSMSVVLRDLQVVIINEISMPFGGKSVLAFGDFLQVGPVRGTPLVSSATANPNGFSALLGTRIWDLFSVHRLTQIMRQRDDIPFATELNNMARGKINPQDIALLRSRVIRLTDEQKQQMRNQEITMPDLEAKGRERPVCLYHWNRHVKLHNCITLASMTTDGAAAISFDQVFGAGVRNTSAVQNIHNSVANDDNCTTIKNRDLLRTLQLKIGAFYMVVSNMNTADGIVNGATTGYLRTIDYGTNRDSSDDQRPMRIWIEFDNLDSGRATRETQRAIRSQKNYPEQWTMLLKTKALLVTDRTNRLELYRTQFPVVPAEAITVHNSQGSTYANVLVNTFYKAFPRDILYVACSRAISAAGSSIITKDNRFAPPRPLRLSSNNTASDLRIKLKRENSKRLELEFAFLSQSHENDNLIQVISHNIQSLRAHLDQVVNDPGYLSFDILLFNETWTLPNEE